MKEAKSQFVTREHPQSVIATCDTSRRTYDAHDDARACNLARSEPRPVGAERTCGCACGFHMRVAWQETVYLPECVRKRGMQWRNGRCYERMHMIVADLMIMCDRTSRWSVEMVLISHGLYGGWLWLRQNCDRTQVSGVQGRGRTFKRRRQNGGSGENKAHAHRTYAQGRGMGDLCIASVGSTLTSDSVHVFSTKHNHDFDYSVQTYTCREN